MPVNSGFMWRRGSALEACWDVLECVGITLHHGIRVFFEDPPHRQHMVFLGASIMADAYEQQAREGSLIGN